MHDFEVEVDAGGAARAAHGADLGSRCDGLAVMNFDLLQVTIECRPLAVVFDQHHIAVTVKGAAGINHFSLVRRKNGSAALAADIDPFVTGISRWFEILRDANGTDRPLKVELIFF